MNRFALSLVGIVAVAAIAACGGGGAGSSIPPPASSAAPPASLTASASAPAEPNSSSGPAGSAIAACDLLTDADILELTDLEVAEAVPGMAQGVFQNGCEWSLTGETASSNTAITLGVLVPGGRALWDRSFKPFGAEMGMTDIEGLGDEAQLGEIDDVIAVQGDAMVSLQFLAGFGSSDDLPVELLRRVLENLAAG